MPNWVKNVVKFKKVSPEDVDTILFMIGRELTAEADDCYTPERVLYTIDFNKIIPEPTDPSECPEKYLRTEDDHVGADPDKPWFNWYTWHCTYWGTKWSAMHGYSITTSDELTLIFDTAWSAPMPIVNKLTLLGHDFDFKVADEDYGSNCGSLTYRVKTGWKEKELKNPASFAKRLWGEY